MKDTQDRPIKILICDDDPADRKLIKSIFSKIRDRSFEIFEAGGAEQIQDFLDNKPIDLILLDLAMPEKSGKVWLSEIVEKNIAPVVIITGHGELEDSFEAMRFGAYAYISKSWLSDMNTAVSTIKRTINYSIDQWDLERSLDAQMKDLHGHAKILICDDDPADRRLISTYLRQLKKLNLEIDEAGSSDEIENAIENKRFDVILMDHSMPYKSGIEWASEIISRKLAPVVMITSHGSENLAVEALKLGISDYIPKDTLCANRLYRSISGLLK